MRVEDLNRGHWFVIAVLIGSGIAWLQLNIGDGSETANTDQRHLEQLMLSNPVKDKSGTAHPWVNNIIIYPSVKASISINGQTLRRSLITFGEIKPQPGTKKVGYEKSTVLAGDPYIPLARRMGAGNLRAQDYFAMLKESAPWISYRYAWWREPKWAYATWIGGCVGVIAIVWPFVLNGLVGAGYGVRSEKQEKGPSLWKRLFAKKPKKVATARFTSGSTVKSPSATLAMSAEELQRMEQMEEGLKDFLSTSANAADEGEEADAVAPVKELHAGPLEVATDTTAVEDPKDYAGDFYPTIAHGKTNPGARDPHSSREAKK